MHPLKLVSTVGFFLSVCGAIGTAKGFGFPDDSIIDVEAAEDHRRLQTNSDFVTAGFQTAALNQLIDTFAQSFFPSLQVFIDQAVTNVLTASAQEGSCCSFGDFGVRASVSASGFSFGSIGSNQISIVTLSSGPRSARIRVGATDVALTLGRVVGSATAVAVVPISCSLTLRATATVDSLFADLDLSLNSAGTGFTIRAVTGGLSGVNLDLRPTSSDVCGAVAGLLVSAVSAIANALEGLIVPELQGVISDAVTGAFPPTAIDLPFIPPLVVLEGNSLTIGPRLNTLFSLPSGLFFSGTTTISGALATPSFRSGRSHPVIISGGTTASFPSLDALANISVYSNGINAIIEAVWYVVWAVVADNELGTISTLCQSEATDPCPFPPLVIVNDRFGFDGYLSLSRIFLSQGLFSSFRTNLLVPPPSLDVVEEENSITGTALGVMRIEGVERDGTIVELAQITFPASVTLTIPTYDGVAGTIDNLSLSSIDFGDIDLEFFGFELIALRARILIRLVERILNRVEGQLTRLANNALATALEDLPPLKIPTLVDAPIPGTDLTIDLTSVSLDAVSETSTRQSHLNLEANVRIVAESTARSDLPVIDQEAAREASNTFYREGYSHFVAETEEMFDENLESTMFMYFSNEESASMEEMEVRMYTAETGVQGDVQLVEVPSES